MLKISEKLRPFSHQPGTACIVPGSDWIISVYPTLLRVQGVDFPIHLTGPVREFTVQMDLERDCVWIWGIAKEGHFRFKLVADEIELSLLIDRAPKEGVEIGTHKLKAKQKILLMSGGHFLSPSKVEKLSLGNWKAQDWDLVRRRNLVSEWVPVLYALAQKVPQRGEAYSGPLSLIDKPADFFHAAFEGILVPHFVDPLHQGLFSEDGHGNSLGILTKAFQKVRSYLIQENQILPALPSDWHSGRILHLETAYGRVDLEWTKGTIRQMVLYAEKSGEASFVFSKVKSFRFNRKRVQQKEPLLIESGNKYLFDRFQK